MYTVYHIYMYVESDWDEASYNQVQLNDFLGFHVRLWNVMKISWRCTFSNSITYLKFFDLIWKFAKCAPNESTERSHHNMQGARELGLSLQVRDIPWLDWMC